MTRGWLLGTCFFAAACGGAPVTPGDPGDAPPLVERAPSSTEPETASEAPAAKDASMTVAEYVARGVPSPDAPWSPHRFLEAAEALKSIATESRDKLPRAGSTRSGALFYRLAATDNLDTLDDSSVPLADRIELARSYLAAMPSILALYHSNDASDARFGAEKIALVVALLELVDRAFTLLRDDEKARPEMAELTAKRLRELSLLAASIAGGAVKMVEESDRYSLTDRTALAGRLADRIGTIAAALPKEARRQLGGRLARAADDLKESPLKTELERARAATEAP